MKKINFFMLFLMFINPLVFMSVNSWMVCWLIMELNTVSFLTFLMYNNKNLYDSPMKYFLINSWGSLLFFLMMLYMINDGGIIYKITMNLVLMLKLGLFPFYQWYVEFMMILNWLGCFLLSVWQKLIPLLFVQMLNMKDMNTFFFLINGIFSLMLILNEVKLKKIMVYSSMNHMGWMLMSMNYEMNLFWMYFIVYLFLMMNLMMIFNKMNCETLLDFYNYLSKTSYLKVFLMMSIGGLPPFWGFYMKFLIIQELIKTLTFYVVYMLIIYSLFILYFYMQMVLNYLLMNYIEFKYYNSIVYLKEELVILFLYLFTVFNLMILFMIIFY